MADVIHFLIHLLWAAVASYALTVCRSWLVARVGTDEFYRSQLSALKLISEDTAKTVVWLKSELEKLRAIPRSQPRL